MRHDRHDGAMRRAPGAAIAAVIVAAALGAGCEPKPGDGATGVNPPASSRKGDQMPQSAPAPSTTPGSTPSGSGPATSPPPGSAGPGGASPSRP